MRTLGVVKACGKRWVWLALPEVFPNRILTLERKRFPKDMKNAETVDVEVDPVSLYSTDVHYRADLEVLGVVTRREFSFPGEPYLEEGEGPTEG